MLHQRSGIAALLLIVLSACGGEPAPTEPPVPPELSTYAPIGQLPGDARPLSYDVLMTVDPRGNTFSGDVTLTVELDSDTSGFWMHGDDLRVSDVSISSPSAPNDATTGTWEEVLESGVVRVGFAQNYGPGIVDVRIQYEANFDENLAGLFRVVEQGDAYALAKSESIQARRFLPSFDEPSYKVPFDIRLDIPETMTAVSSAPLVDEVPLRGGMKRVSFDRTRPLPTYLLSVSVGPFDIVDAGVLPPNEVRSEPIPLRGITRKGRSDDIARALEVTPRLMEIFELELQQPYPYKKLDIVAAPAWPSGATELAGAITYRESRILLNDQSGIAAERSMLRIHTHELAHMWFGNLVTPPWWDDLWLKEAFATWGTPISLSQFEPEGKHELDAVGRGLSAMRLDSLSSVRAVREPIDRNEDIRNAYDAITYSKGMAVIRMMDEYFGAEQFRPALGRYVSAYEDGVAASPEFFEIIGEVSGEPRLTEAFRSFVEQKGVPVITVSDVPDEGGALQFRVRQDRYAPLGSNIAGQQSWTIPVCVKVDGREQSACQILDTRDAIVRVLDAEAAHWVMPNAGAQGYYRFNLPENMWAALAEDFGLLSTAEQLATVDSAFAMFEAGALSAELLLQVVEAAVFAEDRRVITAPTQPLSRYTSMMVGADRSEFQVYLAMLYSEPLRRAQSDTREEARLLEGAVYGFLAFAAEDAELRAETVQQARAFLGIGGTADLGALYSDEYQDAFTVLMQDGTEEDFFALAAEIDARDDPRFQLAAISALGASRNPELAAAVRQSLLDGDFGPRESYGVIANQMAEPAVREEAWAWLKANFPDFVARIPRQWPRRTPGLINSFCDTSRLPELDALFAEYGEVAPGHEAALSQTRERIELCSALKTQKLSELLEATRETP